MKVFIPPLSLAHSDYAEPFTGSAFNHALSAAKLGIIRDSAHAACGIIVAPVLGYAI
jgi:hypothetical protein